MTCLPSPSAFQINLSGKANIWDGITSVVFNLFAPQWLVFQLRFNRMNEKNNTPLSCWPCENTLPALCSLVLGQKKMCKTSSKVLNINFSESQTGVKGRKPRVSIRWTIRRWAATLRELSPLHPPSFKDGAPPLADPWARVQPAQLQQSQKAGQNAGRKEALPGRLGGVGGNAPEASAGYRRCSPW